MHPGPHCSSAWIISEVICAPTGPANNHYLTRFNQQLLAANKIAVVKYNPHPVTAQTQTNPCREPGKGQMPAGKSPLPSKCCLRFFVKHPTSSKGGWNLPGHHFATCRWAWKGACRREGGRHLLSLHLQDGPRIALLLVGANVQRVAYAAISM